MKLAREEYLSLLAVAEARNRVSVAPPDGLQHPLSKARDPLEWYAAP